MAQKASHYRQDGDSRIIDVAIQDLGLLFNPLDPSPPPERDLDASTEDYILGALREIGMNQPLKLVFHIPPDQFASTDAQHFATTIRNYFAYRAWGHRMALDRLLQQGWLSLLIGLCFLFICILLQRFLEMRLGDDLGPFFGKGFDIIGWVAMWRPIEIFLYDWWPLALERRRFLRLSAAPISLSPLRDDPAEQTFRRKDQPAPHPAPSHPHP